MDENTDTTTTTLDAGVIDILEVVAAESRTELQLDRNCVTFAAEAPDIMRIGFEIGCRADMLEDLGVDTSRVVRAWGTAAVGYTTIVFFPLWLTRDA